MAQVRSRRIRGNLAFYDTHRMRLIDAIGPDVVKVIEDFTDTDVASNAIPGWTNTLVNSSTVTLGDASGGTIVLTADTAENDGVNAQIDSEAFELTSDQDTYFGVRVTLDEATQSDLLVGLCITNTALLGGMTDGVYFECLDGSTDINFVEEKDSTESTTASAVGTMDTSAHTYEFYWDGTADTVYAYLDGSLVATVAADDNHPDNEALAPSIAFLAGATGGMTATVDWIRTIQIGR